METSGIGNSADREIGFREILFRRWDGFRDIKNEQFFFRFFSQRANYSRNFSPDFKGRRKVVDEVGEKLHGSQVFLDFRLQLQSIGLSTYTLVNF